MSSLDPTARRLLEDAVDKGKRYAGNYLVPDHDLLKILYDYLLEKENHQATDAIQFLLSGNKGPTIGINSREGDYWWSCRYDHINKEFEHGNAIPPCMNKDKSGYQPIKEFMGPLFVFVWLLENWEE